MSENCRRDLGQTVDALGRAAEHLLLFVGRVAGGQAFEGVPQDDFLAPQIRDGFQPERVSKSVPIGVSMTNGVGNEKPSMISQKWRMIRVGGAWLYGARLRANWEPIS